MKYSEAKRVIRLFHRYGFVKMKGYDVWTLTKQETIGNQTDLQFCLAVRFWRLLACSNVVTLWIIMKKLNE